MTNQPNGHYLFELKFKVRDYECDLQGVVNNAVYLHYLEHARHEFLRAEGIDFEELIKEGVNAVVVKAEIEYKRSLRSRNDFAVRINLRRQGHLRFIFDQDVVRLPDETLAASAKITAVCLQGGRPVVPPWIIRILEKYRIG